MELPAIKEALAQRAEDVARHLLPGGKLDKNEYVCGNIGGGEGKSLKVAVRGNKLGVWRDFAGELGGGNLLELWVQVRGVPFREALKEAQAWLEKAGVRMPGSERRVVEQRKKTYSKPNKKGITRICSKVEFYMHAERRIPLEVVHAYKISSTEQNDAIVFPYLHENAPHEAQMIKWLKLERDEAGKKVTWTSANTAKVLFGKHTVKPNDKHILICEGETDCLTWAGLGIPGLCCTSVPFGAKWAGADGKDPNDEWIENDYEFINSFERIYLSFDMDDAGKRACASIIKRLGRELCWVINLPEPFKDANELAQAGEEQQLHEAFEKARTVDPTELKNASEYASAAIDRLTSGDANVRKGIPLPFGAYPFHIRWNEVTLITGWNGSGKTQLVNFICLYLKQLGNYSAVASLEVPPDQTLSHMALQVLGKDNVTPEEAARACAWISEGFWFFDHVGTIKWKVLLETFRYAYRRYGVRIFVIDSFMACEINEDDLNGQQEFANALACFVNELPVHLFLIAHPRKGKDTTQAAGKMDVKGSGGLTDRVHNVITVHRNEKKEKSIEVLQKFGNDEAKINAEDRTKPDAHAHCVKQRNGDGSLPTIDLWFRKACKQFFGYFMPKDKSFSFLESAPPAPPASTEPVQPEQVEDDMPF